MSTANDTIRSALSEAVDEINKLISVTADPDEARQLHCLREIFFDLWEGAIKAEIDDSSPIYTNAITLLQQSEAAAEAAQEDISQIADAISKAVSAAKVVDKVLNLGVEIAKFFP
jgi:hypothetical protein